jgi:Holliday junction resolvase RusA-like endonuclease
MSNAILNFTVYGEPASKANSRKLVTISGKPRFIKSKKAREYVETFAKQCPQIDPPLDGDLKVTIKIYYASRRPDLDESVILDCMQSETTGSMAKKTKKIIRPNVYLNDRQVKEKHVTWGLDPDCPRAEIEVEEIDRR